MINNNSDNNHKHSNNGNNTNGNNNSNSNNINNSSIGSNNSINIDNSNSSNNINTSSDNNSRNSRSKDRYFSILTRSRAVACSSFAFPDGIALLHGPFVRCFLAFLRRNYAVAWSF